MFKRENHRLLMLTLLMPLVAVAAESGLRESLFEKVDESLSEARTLQAELLAPRSFGKAMQAYRDAEERLERGQSLERIRLDLELARSGLDEAVEHAKTAAPLLSKALAARSDARASDAQQLATEAFIEADEALVRVASDLERGRMRDVAALDDKIANDYRGAELAAIKNRYLSDSRRLFAQAKDMRVERYAPKTLAQARQLLAEADRALSEDRYDADRPRSLAREANYQASHAIYLAGRFSDVRNDKLSMEELLQEWETGLERIGDAGDLVVRFDNGPSPVAEQIVDYIKGLQSENAGLVAALSDRDQQIAQMEIEIQDLENRLGGVARERSVLQEELARQARVREQFQQVEAIFEPEEAIVIREQGKITLRLVSLSFGVGESDIGAENFPLLAKVQSATRIFPRARLVVEGHTDSFGSDEKNLELSRERAEAVRQYLLANLRLNPGQISAIGHGEEKPIANNETKEGRSRNRRIELIMYPEN